MTPMIGDAVLAAGSSLAASILVKVTLTTGLALVGVRLARRSRAAVRHVLLAAAFAVLMILPIASIVVPAVGVEVPIAARGLTESPVLVFTDAAPVAEPVDAVVPMPPGIIRSSLRLSVPVVLLAGWAVGALVFLLPILVGLWQMRSLRRFGLPWRHGQAVVGDLAFDAGIHRGVDVLLHGSMPGPATCGVVRPTIVLPVDAQTWNEEDLRRAVVHELEHVRRGDCLTQCLARAVCAMYWFHPLVWIAWRQLALEAERACDDAVLRRAAATAYADQLVALAQRLSSATNQPLLAMANRNDLATRVAAVLDSGQARGRASASAVTITSVAAVVLLAMLSPLRMVAAAQAPASDTRSPLRAAASAQSSPATDRPVFEVASVRPNGQGFGIMGGDCRGSEGGGTDSSGGGIAAMAKAAGVAPTPPGRCRFTRVTLKQLIAYAYAIPPLDMDRMIAGGPRWIDGDRFDVEAKSEALVPVAEMRLMLQRMLADRFTLRLHREPREMQGYALVVATGGAKLQEATGSEPRSGMTTIGGGPVTASKTTMSMLATFLAQRLGRPVEDRTALAGRYNFTLSWTPGDDERPRFGVDPLNLPPEIKERLQSNSDRSGTSVFTALQEQLGLRLLSQQVTGEILVVDAADLPSEN